MSTEKHTGRQLALTAGAAALLALVIGTGLLLREHAPGNMGAGFLSGAALALGATLVRWWWVRRRPDRATTLERAWTQTGDERDDAVLTRALAALGLLAFPLTGVTAIAIGLGVAVEMMLTLLLLAEVAVGAVAFAVINRTS